MSDNTLSIPGGNVGKVSISNVLTQIAETLWLWRFRYVSRRSLRSLDSHMRKDIGLDPSDAVQESMKPFWRA